jgi:hypothetical protein
MKSMFFMFKINISLLGAHEVDTPHLADVSVYDDVSTAGC